MPVSAQYNIARPGSLPVRVAAYQRRKMFGEFLYSSGIVRDDTVLDIGATRDRSYDHSNYLEAWYPHKDRITALGIDDAAFLAALYPGLQFVQGDGRRLPFADYSFDFVHSSAVLEHVGSRARQQEFLGECWRVARKGIFVTTPNRWFPVEFHTVMPLLHWLPAPLFRAVLAKLGHAFLAREENLNLLSRGDLAALARSTGIARFSIASVTLGRWPTNLLLCALRAAGNRGADCSWVRERNND